MLQTGWPCQIAPAPGRTTSPSTRGPHTELLLWMSHDRMDLHGEVAQNGGYMRRLLLTVSYAPRSQPGADTQPLGATTSPT